MRLKKRANNVSDYASFIKKEEFKIAIFTVGFIPQLVCFFLIFQGVFLFA
jgi:hypothetical protein